MTLRINLARVTAIVLVALGTVTAAEAAAPESKRLIRARDFITDEQWTQAIDLLRVAVDDPKEPRKDEALYWLAHSQYHSGDAGAAVATISRLEREFPRSMWVKPGQSLRIDIAVRLGRNDVLLWTATPRSRRVPLGSAPAAISPEPPAPAGPTPVTDETPKPPTPKPGPRKGPAKDGGTPMPAVPPRAPAPAAAPAVPPPAAMWYASDFDPDPDIRVYALGGLLRSDADRAIPLLVEIALESDKPTTASRAVTVLAQSRLPKAREKVVEVATTAPQSVQIAAVKALVGFGGRAVSGDLMQVYFKVNEPVKVQIVKSLGDLEQPAPLLQIVNAEKEGLIRYTALASLGRAGAVDQLEQLYKTSSINSRRYIIEGFAFARADAQLIRVADLERKGNPQLRRFALDQLKLFGSPRAKEYLQREIMPKSPEKR
jgi:hypothetical protein